MNSIKNNYKKIKIRIWEITIDKFLGLKYSHILYKSYWHSKISPNGIENGTKQYLTLLPNEGAGIGHQMSNWMTGYYFARKFQLDFLHIPFLDDQWEELLNFGENEAQMETLSDLNYKIINLPKFNSKSIKLIRKIIASYKGKKIIFLLERDQFCINIAQTSPVIKNKFYSKNKEVTNDDTKENYINIGLHIRRGDIVKNHLQDANLGKRWLDNHYYYQLLTKYLADHPTEKKNIELPFILKERNKTFPSSKT